MIGSMACIFPDQNCDWIKIHWPRLLLGWSPGTIKSPVHSAWCTVSGEFSSLLQFRDQPEWWFLTGS